MGRASNHGVLARRASPRRCDFGANAFLFEIFELLGDPQSRESHVRNGGQNGYFPKFFLLRFQAPKWQEKKTENENCDQDTADVLTTSIAKFVSHRASQFITTRDSRPETRNHRISGYGLPTYLFVQSTPSLFDGAWASLTMPAPVEKLMTFCHPAGVIFPQAGMAPATML